MEMSKREKMVRERDEERKRKRKRESAVESLAPLGEA